METDGIRRVIRFDYPMKKIINNYLIFIIINMIFVIIEGCILDYDLGYGGALWLIGLFLFLSPMNSLFLFLLYVLNINRWLLHSTKGVSVESVIFAGLWRTWLYFLKPLIGDYRLIFKNDGSIMEKVYFSDAYILFYIFVIIGGLAFVLRNNTKQLK